MHLESLQHHLRALKDILIAGLYMFSISIQIWRSCGRRHLGQSSRQRFVAHYDKTVTGQAPTSLCICQTCLRRSTDRQVRVPRLKGKKVGVFATRSPHRPCPIGLTVAKVISIIWENWVFFFELFECFFPRLYEFYKKLLNRLLCLQSRFPHIACFSGF